MKNIIKSSSALLLVVVTNMATAALETDYTMVPLSAEKTSHKFRILAAEGDELSVSADTTEFSLNTNSCTTRKVMGNGPITSADVNAWGVAWCDITVNYTPTSGYHSNLFVLTNVTDGSTLPFFVSNSYNESAAAEAQRRLPPVIEKVKLEVATAFDGEGLPMTWADASTFENDSTYRFTYFVASYNQTNSYRTKVIVQDCNAVGVGCLDLDSTVSSKEATNGVQLGFKAYWGVAVDPVDAENEGLKTYFYSGVEAEHYKYEYEFTLADVFAGVIDAENLISIRVFADSAEDNSLIINARQSVVFAGNLDFTNVNATVNYQTEYSRRIQIQGYAN